MGSNLGAEQEHFFHASLSQIRIDLKYFPPSSSLIKITTVIPLQFCWCVQCYFYTFKSFAKSVPVLSASHFYNILINLRPSDHLIGRRGHHLRRPAAVKSGRSNLYKLVVDFGCRQKIRKRNID